MQKIRQLVFFMRDKNKKISLLAFIGLYVGIFPLIAQKSERDQMLVKIETPTVASFTKFIDHPVDVYNGNPDISIPIYTLKDGAIEIPITMRYHTSGIKVNEEAGWAGLGWNLNVGGVIVQNVVGKKDKESFFKATPEYYPTGEFTRYKQIPYRVDDKNKYNTFFFNAAEGNLEPDVFLLSYPGYSGKFFIDYRNNTIHLLRKDKPIKITPVTGGWQITTETGIIHSFGSPKDTYPAGKTESIGCTYYLLKSVYPNGQTINYSYTSSTLYPYQYTENQTFVLSGIQGIPYNQLPTPYKIPTTFKGDELTLSSIQTDNYTIEFITSSRNDLHNGKKLDEIKVSARQSTWGVTPKRFKFTYDYFLSGFAGSYWPVSPISGFSFDIEKAKRRLKLLSIHEVIGTSTVYNKYSFDYDATALPVKNSYAVDYWGYYNGQTGNTSLVPDFEKFLWGLDIGKQLSTRQRLKANRAYNFEFCQAGILKQITYPTGGRSVYTYEPNEFQYTHPLYTVQELNKSNIIGSVIDRNNRNDTKEIEFTLTARTEVKIKLRLSRGLNSWSDMFNSCYELKQGSTFITRGSIGSLSTRPTDSYEEKEITVNLVAGTYQFNVDIPDALGDQYGSTLKHGELSGTLYRMKTESTGPIVSTGAGLRVSKVDFYESAGNSTSTYTVGYEYTGGVLYASPFYHRLYGGVSYAVSISSQQYLLQGVEEAEISGSNYSSNAYSLANGIVGYSKVVERINTGGNNAGHKEYYFFNSGETNTSASIQIPNSRNGLKSSTLYYNAKGIKVSSEEFKYSINKKHHYWGVNLIDKFNRTPAFFSGLGSLVGGSSNDPRYDLGNHNGRYFTLLYELGSYENLLTSKETIVDGVTTKELYEYNTHGFLKKTTLTQSNNKSDVTQITYPSDYSCGVYSTMQSKNMLAFPVEKRNIVSGNLVAGSLTEYITRGTDIVPSSLSLASLPSSGNPTGFSCSGVVASIYPQRDTRFHVYDSRSNPVHVSTDSEASHTVYLWGYNYQYPVAKIENATYDQVKTALGNVTPESLSSAVTPNMTTINGLRTKLPQALITTYTYKPLLGIESMTSPTGVKTTYEYNTAGRLYRIKDQDGKIVEQYDYNYRP